MRTRELGQTSPVKQVLSAIMGAIKEALMAGQDELPVGPDPTRRSGGVPGITGVLNHAVVFSHADAKVEHARRRAPSHGGKRLHLAMKMRHHVETVRIPAGESLIGFEIDDGEILARTMNKILIPVGFQGKM